MALTGLWNKRRLGAEGGDEECAVSVKGTGWVTGTREAKRFLDWSDVSPRCGWRTQFVLDHVDHIANDRHCRPCRNRPKNVAILALDKQHPLLGLCLCLRSRSRLLANDDRITRWCYNWRLIAGPACLSTFLTWSRALNERWTNSTRRLNDKHVERERERFD